MKSDLEYLFSQLWLEKYPHIDLHSEYEFAKEIGRKYRFDFAHVQTKIAVEINGGIYQRNSGHSSLNGLKRDYEKNSLAASLGWRVFTLSSEMITDYWLDLIAKAIIKS